MSVRRFDWTIAAAATAVLLILSTTALPVAAASQLPGHFQGEAWGSRANAAAGNLASRLGKSAYVPCPCPGTDGQIRTNTTDSVDGGDAYRSGKVTSTAQAEKRPQMRAFAQTMSKVTNVRALGGIITAASMQAVATVNANSTSITPNYAGTNITGLKVNGQPTTVNPGQRINLPGIGYVVFNDARTFRNGATMAGAQVEMMRIVITHKNNLGIAVGSVITSTHASILYTRQELAKSVDAAAWGASAQSTSSDVANKFGRSAPAYLGCLSVGAGSATTSNRIASTSYPGTFATDEIVNSASGKITSGASVAQGISRLKGVNLLNGVVTADVIRGVATASVDGAGGHSSFAGSRFVSLKVLGRAIGDNVAANTQVPLPGLGSLTLYATRTSLSGNTAQSIVDMIVVHVSQANPQGIPAGTDIVIGHAQANARR